MPNFLEVKFLSPTQSFFEGKARYVQSVNSKGPFSIFPGHAQFVTLIKGTPVLIVDDKGQERVFDNKNVLVLYSTAYNVIIFSKNLT